VYFDDMTQEQAALCRISFLTLRAEARPEMAKVRQAVLDSCKKHNVKFLQGANATNVVPMIRQGALVLEAPESAAIIGREFTKRKMPV
jgi:hypothetical protein